VQPDWIILHSDGVSLILEGVPGGTPLWRYWGPRLPDGVTPGLSLPQTRETPSFSLDHPVHFPLFPGFGLGWFGQSGLLAHSGGRHFAFAPQRCDVAWIRSGEAIRIDLADDVSRVGVSITLDLDPVSDVLTVRTAVTNRGDRTLHIHHLAAACLPLPDDAQSVRHHGGRHNGEFLATEDRLGLGQWRRENRHGLTSHEAFPGAVVTTSGATENAGLAYGAQLGWSGNHVQSIEALDDGRFQWQLGEWLAPGEVALEPGETFASPDVLATCSTQGWGGVARNFHASVRQLVTWPGGTMAPRPVHLNTWEGFYFDHDLDQLKALADAAAAAGIERYVLDDGWFAGRHDDSSSLGDWWPDAGKYPDGLAPLAEHVTGLGMEFGLWVEPEMVNPDSELYRAHPDWALQIAGRPVQTARNQLVLDLSRAEVSDYLFEAIAPLLDSLPIAYLKWDHNRDLVAAGGADGRARYHAQVVAAYALFDRFRAAFPMVEIEACAGGGGRIDAGIIRRTHRFWTSDCIDAVSRLHIQPGFLQYFPPELMGSHIGTAPAHSTGRSQSMDFRAAVACQGHLGVEFNLLTLDPADRARLSEWIAFYKANRHLLHARVFSGTLPDGMRWHAAGREGEWLLFIIRETPMQLRHMPPVRLPFVATDAQYRVTPVGPAARGEAVTLDGGWLTQGGLPAPHMKGEEALIYRIEAL